MTAQYQTINPATEAVIDTYTLQSDAEARSQLDATHQAFLKWRDTSMPERGKVLKAVARLLRERKDDLCALMTEEMGKPIAQGGAEVELCASICEYTADNGADALADEARELEGGRALVTYQPIGVVLGIQPWNFPLYQVVRYSIANLMAGNGVLLKHAPNVWGCALALASVYRDAGLPDDLFAVLRIEASQVAALIERPKVRGVTLTGSPAAGAKVAAKAGECLKKSVLELGSNDAYLVLHDADIERAVATCVQGRINNNGQTCVAAKRFVVVDAVYEQFRDAFVEQMAAIEYGDPTDPDTQLGPIARKDLREKLHNGVINSIEAGARCVTGGEVPDGKGFFYPSTVLENVQPGMPAYDDELFGPVAALIRAKDDEDALRIANDSRFGLGGGIFSRDEARAVRMARERFDTGMVNINGYRLAQPQLPFGGVKDSGYGREHGGFGIREFVNAKTVMIVD
ncbi:NAD-dependent succinate-semialdehyde dehydrogenase [Oleiagrimonas sp. C23AA]|uniref:NAD-dependent succinate-semialdehyde dehydrogenase n=1 Tax=Oleiagrimonas sp. C23AA TaxID=2719047 RepID=UPI00141E9A22|nr:NAD-dependent succinate-semialdehyde dehydrogenase [Oleiagrimonas sp. C23AA]NII09577.1 NAD-dependent succinate-semialdehyde dehydrogenase [Oleiagrimonas sp. C23AA]